MNYYPMHSEMIMSKTILIGIAGGTGSGKTSVANAIIKEFSPKEVALIQQDSYYKDLPYIEKIAEMEGFYGELNPFFVIDL